MTNQIPELRLLIPIAIEKAAHAADREVGHIARREQHFKTWKRGRPKKEVVAPPEMHFGVFVANNPEELDHLLRSHIKLVGAPYRGNKRRGKSALYADLLQFFIALKVRGVTLPRNRSLSRKVCELGIGEILRKHGYTQAPDESLISNLNGCRAHLAKKMSGIFARIVSVL